jgi:hypothetical protein
MGEMGQRSDAVTPTLLGRWQTRIALVWTLGLALTVGWMQHWKLFAIPRDQPDFWKLLALLGYVTVLGLAWDILYTHLQSYRWDCDWPLVFHFICGIGEGIVVFALFRVGVLWGLTYEAGDAWRFLLHYGSVFLVIYGWSYGPMRVIAPRWRFNGGELL